MSKILVTGGTGYIGSHTIIDLIENGFEVISVDNHSRSDEHLALEAIEKITGQKIRHYPLDLCDLEKLESIFDECNQLTGIIHFAAFKSVPESVNHPLSYYRNNLVSLINLLELCEKHKVKNFIFSSSCSIYGNKPEQPVDENTEVSHPDSPYGNTKKIGEEIIKDLSAKSNNNFIALRYFNPVGAHPSGFIGENPITPAENLMPVITETAAGIRKDMSVFGTDYDTRDGSCIRDYVHVMDIAHAHILALKYLLEGKSEKSYDVYNLGTGKGVSVLEMISSFEKTTSIRLNYKLKQRRSGDVPAVFSNCKKAHKDLGWQPKFDLKDMVKTAWNWQLKKPSK